MTDKKIDAGKRAGYLCTLSDLEATGAYGVEHEEAHFGSIVVRFEDSARAYVNRCPHIGTPLELFAHHFLDEAREQLVCVTHGARFNVSDGVCTQGPCIGDKLRAIDVELEGENIFARPGQLKAQSQLIEGQLKE